MSGNPLRLPHITCACGATTGTEPSFDKAVEMYRAHECPSPGLCAICCGESEPVRTLRLDGKDVLVCRRCEFEHPRGGGYAFDERPSQEPTDLARGGGSSWSLPQHGGPKRR